MVLESLGMDVVFLAGNSSAVRFGDSYFQTLEAPFCRCTIKERLADVRYCDFSK